MNIFSTILSCKGNSPRRESPLELVEEKCPRTENAIEFVGKIAVELEREKCPRSFRKKVPSDIYIFMIAAGKVVYFKLETEKTRVKKFGRRGLQCQ